MSEFITLHIGQCGVQLAEPVWQLSMLQHSLNPQGYYHQKPDGQQKILMNTLFDEQESGKNIPRALIFDTEPYILDSFKKQSVGKLFNHHYLFTGKEDGANNCQRGYMTIGKTYIDEVLNKVISMAEACNNFKGFIFYHSIGGGTGSGFTTLLISRLKVQFPKKLFINHMVCPSKNYCDTVVEPYNAIFGFSSILQYLDMTLTYDNQSLYKIFANKLDIEDPQFFNINSIISQVSSNMMAGERYANNDKFSLLGIQCNTIPYSRLHFLTPSFAPFVQYDAPPKPNNQKNLLELIFDPTYQLVNQSMKSNQPLNISNKNISCSLILRGHEFMVPDIRQVLHRKIEQNSISFVQWLPSHLKINMSKGLPKQIPYSGMGSTLHNATLLANNVGFKNYLQKLLDKFDCLYENRSFIHWFIGEGASGDLPCSRQQINCLIKDYQQIQQMEEIEELQVIQQ